jgi:hypothetical protein
MTGLGITNDACGTADGANAPAHDRENVADHARQVIGELLTLRGITRVISVDDGNRSPGEEPVDLEKVKAALVTKVLTVENLSASEATATLVTGPDGELIDLDDLLDRLRMDPADLEADEEKALTDAARLATRDEATTNALQPEAEAEAATVTDLETLNDLARLFPQEVSFTATTLDGWRHDEAEVLKDPRPALIMFDRDFGREDGGPTEGDKLIASVLGKNLPNVYCALLTHAATSDESELQLISEIAATNHLEIVRLVVMAKTAVTHAPIEMAYKLKTAILAEDLRGVQKGVGEALRDAADAARGEIRTLDAYTVLALVEAASKEGSHDVANVVRLAQSRARRELDTRLRAESFMIHVRQMRAARAAPPTGHRLRPPWNLSLWRHADSFDDAAHLAALRLPVEPGDIFEIAEPRALLNGRLPDGVRKKYILLTQPCDTMIRSDGLRAGDPLTFAAAPLKCQPKDDDKARRTAFRLDWFDPSDSSSVWYVELGFQTRLPVKALDACALHARGWAIIATPAPPTPALTVGWEKRQVKLTEWAGGVVNRVRDLERSGRLNTELEGLTIQALTGATKEVHPISADVRANKGGGAVAFGLRRIARLTDSNTRALLTQTSHHMGRPAADGPLLPEVRLDAQA